MNALQVETPIGLLTLLEEHGALRRVCFGEYEGEAERTATPLLKQAEQELKEYFRGERKKFTVPMSPEGTPFQRKCWEALLLIPYGETWSYAFQAQCIGNPNACRAVGMANHRNPLPVFIPCHRVVGKNGSLTGYAGGLDVKSVLLKLEAGKEFV